MSGHTHIHTHRTTTVTLAAHARRGLTSTVTLAHARRGLMMSVYITSLIAYAPREVNYLPLSIWHSSYSYSFFSRPSAIVSYLLTLVYIQIRSIF